MVGVDCVCQMQMAFVVFAPDPGSAPGNRWGAFDPETLCAHPTSKPCMAMLLV